MKSVLKDLSEVAARANDLFYNKHSHVDTVMGIMDKGLRNQGIKADAITIDCLVLNKKIVILLHDDKPKVASIALGNKEGDIFSSTEYLLTDISEEVLVRVMQENFIVN